MKLVTIDNKGEWTLGVWTDYGIVDIAKAVEVYGTNDSMTTQYF
ncbi:hypothetical protein [Cohnella silvisoli]|uniref:Uncharacterized protein n=1 Tax=Cohnella silvisoli TaxID=2873699 RepID=A0ABV1L1R3_9BACL|nr:hypothetical protein [Cohnella silvisoli]